MTRCLTPGCKRAARTTASGLVFAHCDTCTRLVLRDAFASESASSGLSRIPPATQPGAAHAVPATHTPAPMLAAVTQASPAH